ncbi:hypothetical protein [Burkholderia gladioli]|uniref:hypothetical protein n=1 Tax=Burkholderia gladioli TaxID=28095 RepID=UPI001640A7E1|nr:hypothetical protein [Burkholderia gladioli]
MNQVSRYEADLKIHVHKILVNLMDCFIHQMKDDTVDDFIVKIISPIAAADDRDIEVPIEILMQYVSEDERATQRQKVSRSPLSLIVLSTTYCIRAIQAIDEGDRELAWSYLADAKYWCGVSRSDMGVDKIREEAIVATRTSAISEALTSKARAGAIARDNAYKSVREYVCKLAREWKPTSGWSSRSQAVKKISAAALDFFNHNPPRLKVDGIERTLDKWLSKMPDAAELFPLRKKI